MIEILITIDFKREAIERAFLRNEPHIGRFRPRQMRSGYRSTFDRLFGFKGNARKFLGTEKSAPTFSIDATHISCVHTALPALGFELSHPFQDRGPASWERALDDALTSIARGLNVPAQPVDAALIPHPRWRFLERTDVADILLRRLEHTGAIALVGMPGIGKSILAQQLAAKARLEGQVVIAPDVGRWLHVATQRQTGVAITSVDYVGLWAEVLKDLALLRAPTLSPSERSRFSQRMSLLLQQWSLSAAHLESGEKRLLERIQDRPTPGKLAEAIVAHSTDLRNPPLVADLAAVLRLAVPDALVLLDNVLNIESTEPTVRALFSRRSEDYPSSLNLLITSQSERDNLAFLLGGETVAQTARLVDFQDKAFARRIVAAWGIAGEDDQTRSEAEARIELFRAVRMVDDVEMSKAIDRVIDQVGGHALALAALASVWRCGGHKRKYWQQAFAAIEAAPADVLHLQVYRDSSCAIEKRHMDVLQALRLAWFLLDDGHSDWEATKDRFFDLGITVPNMPIDENVLIEFWKRVDRGPQRNRLPAVVAAKHSPLRRLQSASFVREIEGNIGKFVLHDLHRILISQDLTPSGLASRHRDFLRAFGLIDSGGTICIDEDRHFALIDGRTVVRPDLGSNADDAEIADVGRYLLIALPHHLRAASSETAARALTELAVNYRFLQARIDDSGGNIDHGNRRGNIGFVAAMLRGIAGGPVPILRQALRLSGEAIAEDRQQFAAQLLARISGNTSPLLDKLRLSALRYGPRPTLTPRFPFLAGKNNQLIAHLGAAGGFGGAEWMVAEDGEPVILAWSRNSVQMWNPELGEVRLKIDSASHIGTAKWIADAPGGPAILGWSWRAGKVALWDASTGVLRTEIYAGEHGNEAAWIPDAPDGPAILTWDKYIRGPTCLWNASTGQLRLRIEDDLSLPKSPVEEFGASWIAEASDGPLILTWSTPSNTVCLWSAITGKLQTRLQHEGVLRGAAWIRDALGSPGILSWGQRPIVYLRDAFTGALLRVLRAPSNEPTPETEENSLMRCGAQWIAESDIGPRVLWWSVLDPVVHLWDAKSGHLLNELRHAEGVFDAQWITAFLGGPALLCASPNTIHLWDLRSGIERLRIESESNLLEIQWIPMALAGAPVILSRWRDAVCLHDPVTGREIARIARHEGISGVSWVTEAINGPAILTWAKYTPGAICLWDPIAGAGSLGNADEDAS